MGACPCWHDARLLWVVTRVLLGTVIVYRTKSKESTITNNHTWPNSKQYQAELYLKPNSFVPYLKKKKKRKKD